MHRVYDDRLAVGARRLGHRTGGVDLRSREVLAALSGAAEVSGEQDGVDGRTLQDGVEDRDERGDVLFPRAGEVDWVRHPGGRRQQSAQCAADVGGERRHGESGCLDDVGCDTRVPAAVRDDADPVHLRGSVTEECGRHVRELPWTRHPVHPGFAGRPRR